jgi:hypothetical protein
MEQQSGGYGAERSFAELEAISSLIAAQLTHQHLDRRELAELENAVVLLSRGLETLLSAYSQTAGGSRKALQARQAVDALHQTLR